MIRLGEAPYWRSSLQNGHLFFATKESNQSYTLTNTRVRGTQINHIEGVNEAGEHLSLTINVGDCYMTEGQEYWGKAIEVNTAYGHFEGCGESGKKINEQPFAGQYLSESVQQGKQQSIVLTLNDDHTLQYKLDDESQSLTKIGYWKSNSPSSIVVMLSDFNNNRIQQEIIFQRIEGNLHSSEINTNNQLSQFDTKLTFKKIQSDDAVSRKPNLQIKRQFAAQAISPEPQMDTAVQEAVQQYFKMHRTDPKETRFNSVRFDLNDDGKEEAIVLLDWCSENGCEMLIFEEQEQGLVFSSSVSRVHAPILVSQKRSFSWQSLLVEKQQQWLQLDFDGLHYPSQISGALTVPSSSTATGISLFAKGKPKTWFLIK